MKYLFIFLSLCCFNCYGDELDDWSPTADYVRELEKKHLGALYDKAHPVIARRSNATWNCPRCGWNNHSHYSSCRHCGASR